jgi:multicomponent Na+:H+ antiporter subunit G
MRDGVVAALMLLGAALMLVAALGVSRLPDLFSRMQAAAKAGTVGASLILLGVSVFFAELQVTTRALTVVAFLFLTAPVAAHLLARAGYLVHVPLYRTRIDELRARFGRGSGEPGGTSPLLPPRNEREEAARDPTQEHGSGV